MSAKAVIHFKGFDLQLNNLEIKPRPDLHPDWFEFRFEMPKTDQKRHFVMPTKFHLGEYLFEVLENEPSNEGWFMAKKSRI